jgi:hypothetical protein
MSGWLRTVVASSPVPTILQSHPVCFGEKKIILLLPGTEPRIVQPVTYYTHNSTQAPPNILVVTFHPNLSHTWIKVSVL